MVMKMIIPKKMFLAMCSEREGLWQENARLKEELKEYQFKAFCEAEKILYEKEEKRKEKKEMSKVDETVQEMLDRLKAEEASYEDKLIGVKVAFMFAEAGADAEQMKILTEAKMKILAGLEEQKKGGE